jgi:hypothetical protein
MVKTSVQAILAKHGYRCSDERDRQYLTSWLELLVFLKRLRFDIDFTRNIIDYIIWFHVTGTQSYPGVELNRFEGTLVV